MRMSLSLASLATATASTAQEKTTKMRRPVPKAIERKPQDLQVNFQVLLIPGFKLSMPTLPDLMPTAAHREY